MYKQKQNKQADRLTTDTLTHIQGSSYQVQTLIQWLKYCLHKVYKNVLIFKEQSLNLTGQDVIFCILLVNVQNRIEENKVEGFSHKFVFSLCACLL